MDNRLIDQPADSTDTGTDASAPRIVTELPGPRSRELLARGRATSSTRASPTASLRSSSSRKAGHTVTDVDGNVFVDLASASGSVPLGAARADLIDPAVEAMRAIGNEDSHALATAADVRPGRAARRASRPARSRRVDIALNGTEAVETAIRMMRRATGRPIILGFHGSYHGESTTTATLGAEIGAISAGRAGARPRLRPRALSRTRTARRSARRAPAAAATRPSTTSATSCSSTSSSPSCVAGVVIEPILGSGGCIAPPAIVLDRR